MRTANFATHNGFDYQAIQKAYDEAMRNAAQEAKKEGENDDWLPTIPEFKRGASTDFTTARQESLPVLASFVFS